MKTNEKLISMLEKAGFMGCDVNLEISLFEYGLLWLKQQDTIQFIYAVACDTEGNAVMFDTCTLGIAECNTYVQDNSWVDKKGLLSYLGLTARQWNRVEPENKIESLRSYYGYENVFGTCYYPIDLNTVVSKRLKIN